MAAPAIFTFPDNASLQQLETERSRVIDQNSAGAMVMPLATEDADTILWEIRDDVRGLMFRRFPDEPFPIRKDTGLKRFVMEPGRFGEQRKMDERQIERMRSIGTFGTPIDVGAELSRMMEDIAIQEHQLIEYIRWTLLVTGSISVADQTGKTQEIGRYTPLAYSAATAWSTVATATPLADFRGLRDANAGHGSDFGFRSLAFGSSLTFNKLWANTNQSDIAGKRMTGLGQILGAADYNKTIVQGENLPTLVPVDDGYLDDNGVFQRYIPEGKVVVVGYHWARGTQVGEYVMTRNGAQNGKAGVYAEVDYAPDPPKLPRVTRGHNGGPRVNYANQTVVLTAYTP